jgi:hypothetical protein
MKKLLLTLFALCFVLGLSAQKKQNVSVLYVYGSADLETTGLEVKPDPAVLAKSAAERTASFEKFLKKNFKTVKAVDAKDYHWSMSNNYDVTVLDGKPNPIAPGIREVNDHGYMVRYERPQYFPLNFDRPIITIANFGEDMGRRIGTKNDWYCLCLEDKAHHWNATHPIFQGPVPVKFEAKMEPTPAPALEVAEMMGETLPAETLMFQMQTVNYVENPNYRIGMVSRPGGYLDSPEAEVISSGKCAKSIDAVALGRHANWFTWGFSASPAYMTDAAKALFVNAIVYMKQFAGQHPIAHKFNDGVATRDHIGMYRNRMSRSSWEMYNESNRDFNRMVDSLKAVIRDQHSRGEEVDPNMAIYENFPEQKLITYREFLLQQDRGKGLYKVFGTDEKAYQEYYDKNYGWFWCPDDQYELVIDDEARYLGIANNDIKLLDKCITMLENNDPEKDIAETLLKRYTLCRFATPAEWRSWFNTYRDKLFFTESGGFLWLVNTFENVPGNDYNVYLQEKEEAFIAQKLAGGRPGRDNAPVQLTDEKNPVYLRAEALKTDRGMDIVVFQKIHPGYHTYAVVPADEVFVVTELEITLPEGYKTEGPLYVPQAGLLDASGTMVYRGVGEFRQAISGQGGGEATVKITYQCCNNNTCLVPETKTFTVKL